MTYGITSTMTQNGIIQYSNNKNEQLSLKQGDLIKGSIVDIRDTSVSIAVEEGSSQQIIDLQIGKDSKFNMNDQVEIQVLKRSYLKGKGSVRYNTTCVIQLSFLSKSKAWEFIW